MASAIREVDQVRVFCMVGVRGSGKTTLIQSVLPKLSGFEHVATDSVIRSLVGPHYGDFNNFPDEIKKQFRSRAITYMSQEAERSRKQLIVEDHMALYNPRRRNIERVIPEEAAYFITDLILHSVDARTVQQRRRTDRLVKRTLDLDFIKHEVAIEEAEARKFADQAHLDFHIIEDNGGLEPAFRLLRVLQGY